MTELPSIALPKWPQCVITGLPVTVEQASDIISRTDGFLSYFGTFGHGNNRDWEDAVKRMMGVHQFIEYADSLPDADKWQAHTGLDKVAATIFRRITTNYIKNEWMSSAYINGPHGWCHPDGTIAFCDNIGKWPSVEEVHTDLVTLSTEFPYLDMGVTLMSGEQFDEGKYPLVTFDVKDGVVTTHTTDHEMFRRTVPMKREINDFIFNSRREQGMSDDWVRALAERVDPLFAAAFPEFAARNPK